VLPSEMSIQPSFCHRCCLGNIKPSYGDEWSQSLISRFKGIIMDAELQMKVSKTYNLLFSANYFYIILYQVVKASNYSQLVGLLSCTFFLKCSLSYSFGTYIFITCTDHTLRLWLMEPVRLHQHHSSFFLVCLLNVLS